MVSQEVKVKRAINGFVSPLTASGEVKRMSDGVVAINAERDQDVCRRVGHQLLERLIVSLIADK